MSRETLDYESPSAQKAPDRSNHIAAAIQSVAMAIVFFAGAVIFTGTRGDSEVVGGAIMLLVAVTFVLRTLFSRL